MVMAINLYASVRQDHGLSISRLFYELSLPSVFNSDPAHHISDDTSTGPHRKIDSYMNEHSEPNPEPREGDKMLAGCTQTPPGKVAKLKRFRHSRKRPYFYKPYDFPWRPKLEESFQTLMNSPSTSLENETESAPPTVSVSRQDSGNKSNPGSPVKSQCVPSKTGCSIIRSRSLDDLNIAKFSLYDRLSGRIDIDLVSQRISDLHVS